MKESKIKSDFADAVEIRELKDTHYYFTFINRPTKRTYVFMVPKHLFDSCLEDRVIIDPVITKLSEIKKEQLNNLQDVS